MKEPSRYKPFDKYDAPFDLTRCAASVCSDSRVIRFHQCLHKAKYGPWCGVHDPERKAAREKNRPPSKYERELAAMRRRAELRDAKDAVIEAVRVFLDGNRDANTIDLESALESLGRVEARHALEKMQ